MTDKINLCQPEEDKIYGWFVRTVEEYPVKENEYADYGHMYLTTNLEVKHSGCDTNTEQFYFKNESDAIQAIIDHNRGSGHPPVVNDTNYSTSQPLFEDENYD